MGFNFSHCGSDVPKQNKYRNENKCVREHIRASLLEGPSDYEIDHILDLEKPNDDTIADKAFHRNNFPSSKHNLVVKLRPQHDKSSVAGGSFVRPLKTPEIELLPLSEGLKTFWKDEFTLPTPARPIQPFLVTTYLVADALASQSIKLPAFRVQIRHLTVEALRLTVELNDAVVPEEGATEEQYEEGLDLDEYVKWVFVRTALLTSTRRGD
jgi:hypothetical protein